MKQIVKYLGTPPFSQWKEYQRCLEELEERKDQVNQFRKQYMEYKNSIQHILEKHDHEVKEASKALDRSKHFVKWSQQVRRQCINLYVRNLVPNAHLRTMRKDFEEAHILLKMCEGADEIPPLMKMPKFDPKSKATPSLFPPLKQYDLITPDPKSKTFRIKASSSKLSSKRKRKLSGFPFYSQVLF